MNLVTSAIATYNNSATQGRHETPTAADVDTQKTVRITLQFKDQKLADTARQQLKGPIQEEKPTSINHQCVVYNFKCDSCDADYIGYTTRHLHQRIEEHKASVTGKHVKEVHGVAFPNLAKIFSFLKKCRGKLDCVIQEMIFIRERKLKLSTQSDSIRTWIIEESIYLNIIIPLPLSRQTPMTTKRLFF